MRRETSHHSIAKHKLAQHNSSLFTSSFSSLLLAYKGWQLLIQQGQQWQLEGLHDEIKLQVRTQSRGKISMQAEAWMVSPRLKRQKRNLLSTMSSLILTILKSIVFKFALNSKQTTCETAGKKCVVDETLLKFKKERKLFTTEELCKLRRAETKRKKELSFGSLATSWSPCAELERAWGSQKEH